MIDRGLIDIKLRNNGDSYVLNISDDGVGFPDDVDFRDTESLGMQLVNNLVKQIDGTIELNVRPVPILKLNSGNWSTINVFKSGFCHELTQNFPK